MLQSFKHNLNWLQKSRLSDRDKKNFGLSAAEFKTMVSQMRESDNALLYHIYNVHFEYCKNYLKRRFSIGDEDAYDLFMDVMVIFRAKVLNGKITYGNLKFLYTRLAINYYIDRHRLKSKLEAAIENFNNKNDYDLNSGLNEENRITIITTCMKKLSPKDAKLLHNLYLDEHQPEELAAEMGITYAALRKRKERALKQLKKYTTDELKKDA